MPKQITANHLGGYVPGGDEATWYPDLWLWLIDQLKLKSVLDVGCGEGHAGQFFLDQGCEVIGVEGIKQDHLWIVQHDYSMAPFPQQLPMLFWESFDLVWCCEFVEHVEEKYMRNYLASFKLGRYVAMTHAEPGQAGFHHVNCRTQDYWIGVMASIGFHHELMLSARARAMAATNKDPYNHFARSGMVFKRL